MLSLVHDKVRKHLTASGSDIDRNTGAGIPLSFQSLKWNSLTLSGAFGEYLFILRP